MNDNIIKSLFSLVNTNKGLFKSEKQASFLRSQALNNIIHHTNHYVFGEFNGCTRTNSFEFFLDEKGVNKIIKISNNGDQAIYFDRLNTTIVKSFQDNANKKAHQKMRADRENAIYKQIACFDKMLEKRVQINNLLTYTLGNLSEKEKSANSKNFDRFDALMNNTKKSIKNISEKRNKLEKELLTLNK